MTALLGGDIQGANQVLQYYWSDPKTAMFSSLKAITTAGAESSTPPLLPPQIAPALPPHLLHLPGFQAGQWGVLLSDLRQEMDQRYVAAFNFSFKGQPMALPPLLCPPSLMAIARQMLPYRSFVMLKTLIRTQLNCPHALASKLSASDESHAHDHAHDPHFARLWRFRLELLTTRVILRRVGLLPVDLSSVSLPPGTPLPLSFPHCPLVFASKSDPQQCPT